MGALSIWHWAIIMMLSVSGAPGSGVVDALHDAMQALARVAALPQAGHLLDYSPETGDLGLFRLPGSVCFLRYGGQTDQTNWIRRDDQGRIEIIVSAPVLAHTGHRFDPADGTARLELGGKAVAVPVTSPGAPTWRFTLEDTPALQAKLAAEAQDDGLRFTAIRGGRPVPDETIDVSTVDLAQALQGLDSCAMGAEPPAVIGP